MTISAIVPRKGAAVLRRYEDQEASLYAGRLLRWAVKMHGSEDLPLLSRADSGFDSERAAAFPGQGKQMASDRTAGSNVPNWLVGPNRRRVGFLTWLVGRTHTENHGPHLYGV
jgi:hypothetical protein